MRPDRPVRRADEQAAGEARTFAVSAVGDHPRAHVVDELATGEAEVADRRRFRFDIDARTRRALDDGAAAVAELAIDEIIGAAGGNAEPEAAVVTGADVRQAAARRALLRPDNHYAIRSVVMAEDVADDLRAGVAHENEAGRGHLPA